MNNKKRRDFLFKKSPYCHWCSRPLADPRHYQWPRANGKLQRLLKNYPDNLATLDHIYSKLNPARREPGCKNRTVLACWKCNQRRNSEEQIALFSPEGKNHEIQSPQENQETA